MEDCLNGTTYLKEIWLTLPISYSFEAPDWQTLASYYGQVGTHGWAMSNTKNRGEIAITSFLDF